MCYILDSEVSLDVDDSAVPLAKASSIASASVSPNVVNPSSYSPASILVRNQPINFVLMLTWGISYCALGGGCGPHWPRITRISHSIR